MTEPLRHAGLVPASTVRRISTPAGARRGGPRRGAGVTAVLAALSLAGCASSTIPAPPALAAAPQPTAVPAGMQYLYGSGEGAAVSIEAWHALVRWAQQQVAHRPADSVVLDEKATLAKPAWVPCGAKPFAAVFDIDETVLLNLGAEYDAALHPGPFDAKRWDAWERAGAAKVVPTPGAREALGALRALGVTVIFNTNRAAANAAQTEAALDSAGLGPAVHKQTLWLQGDDNTGGLKDVRRWRIADKYCVIAMGGDQLGDFTDLFNAGLGPAQRRSAVAAAPIAALWGAGWFALPNPAYGTGLKGGVDDVFPADKRWAPPAQEK